MKIMNFIKYASLLCILSTCSIVSGSEKIYIDEEELSFSQDKFYLHQGDNVWISTNTIHRDETGLYTYEVNVSRSISKSKTADYQKTWKCPYCYRHWPIGTRCQNPSCPSKYK